ncbi:putative tat pathway signal sequence protein [Rosellinia necatrix]|uniref:Putative tat pathway signal sequence protein n=1 Tax=Rosellinia necatrix TaxID=77044 RepID=A0A1W2TJT1_ROSNE|nr:putative tat pathway signal sequence protein [Rosellinia necatrix]
MAEPSNDLKDTIREPNISSATSARMPNVWGEKTETSRSSRRAKEEDGHELCLDQAQKCEVSDHQATLPMDLVDVFPFLRAAIASEQVDILNRHQSVGASILEELSRNLTENASSLDISPLSSIKSLQERANNPRTIIGIIGGTGHGKSSLINALLDEEKLIPTSCFRACTAVVTEISWNNSDIPDHRYIAEIEFISVEDWDHELGYLFHDLTGSGEASSKGQLEGSDANIAWMKIKAVYSGIDRKMITETNAKTLVDDPTVKALLGTTKIVREGTAEELYKAIQTYVDSKSKANPTHPSGEENSNEHKMRLWPLIKVVRIYTKADVLSSGAVIVDLPSVRDSNVARAAVAEKYIEKCDSLWVVSMITRAVDDQAAQELLDTGFKRQLQLDGNISNLTFVCSKTDDINVYEAADDLGLDEDARKLRNAEGRLRACGISSNLMKFRERLEAVSTYGYEIDKHISRYEKLRAYLEGGKMVTPPKECPKRRGTKTYITKSNKRLMVAIKEEDQSIHWISAGDFWAELEKDMPKFSAEHHLTQEDIQSMVTYLRSQTEMVMNEKENLRGQIFENEAHHDQLEGEVEILKKELNTECVLRRNDHSRRVIRSKFALGLKELDQQESQYIDPANFDPDQEQRDYTEVGRALPVFCTSSQAYQLLSNGYEMDGFNDVNDTNIPQLRVHAKKLTEARCIANGKSFLNDLLQILNSLYIWSFKWDIDPYITHEEKEAEIRYVREKATELKERLRISSKELVSQLSSILDVLFNHIETAALHGATCAPNVAHSWPSHNPGDEGVKYGTYRAILIRNGVFSSTRGPRNFNADLATPLLKVLGVPWEVVFTKKIPRALCQYIETCRFHQEQIQDLLISHLQKQAVFNGVVTLLQHQNKARVDGLLNKIASLSSTVKTKQREANRSFEFAIQRKLKPTYKEISEDWGRGVFARMTLGMETEITKNCREIFNYSCNKSKTKLSEIPESIQKHLQLHDDTLRNEIVSDYKNAIVGADSSKDTKVVKQKIYKLLREVDGRFRYP